MRRLPAVRSLTLGPVEVSLGHLRPAPSFWSSLAEFGCRLSTDWHLTQDQDFFLGLEDWVNSPAGALSASQVALTGSVIQGDVDVSPSLTSGPQTLAITSVWIPGANH